MSALERRHLAVELVAAGQLDAAHEATRHLLPWATAQVQPAPRARRADDAKPERS